SDTRADFAPSLALDADGQVVAVWERVRDAAFTSEDVADMAAAMEVAFAWRDAATGAWSVPDFLTNNAILDHSARLLTAPDGSVALTWLSSSGDLLATAAHPVTVHMATWSPATRAFTETPAPLVLPNLVTHSSAWSGTEAVLVGALDVDGDPLTTGDTVIAR